MGIKTKDFLGKGIMCFDDPWVAQNAFAYDESDVLKLANDAASPLITSPNSGIPVLFTTYQDPTVIEILQAPLTASELFPEVQKGSWTDTTAIFLSVESTGYTAPYGDFSGQGKSGFNANFPERQNYGFQTNVQFGDKQVALAGEAHLNFISLQNAAVARTLTRQQNDIYFRGVAGLQNYGLLNDPNLLSVKTPTTGTGGNTWALKTVFEQYNDIKYLYSALVTQSMGVIRSDDEMTLGIAPALAGQLTGITTYNTRSLLELIKGEFPKLKIVTVPELGAYDATSNPGGQSDGNHLYLVADKVDGAPAGQVAFAEKQRSHGVTKDLSGYKEKRSCHTWGFVVYRPLAIVQMNGL